MSNIQITDKRSIGQGQPCFIIAEAGVNHNGDTDKAVEMIEVAARAGADAIKFQTFKAESLASPDAPQSTYQIENTGISEPQIEMLKRLELPLDSYPMLIEKCKKEEIVFLSTPFDPESIEFLTSLGDAIPAFKVGSGDANNDPHLGMIAKTGKPVLLSTGMCTMEEVERSVNLLRSYNTEIALFQCTSSYPAAPEDINLSVMHTFREKFQAPTGFSDHSEGIAITIAAVALGADLIEKHFTLSRTLKGPDHKASLEPGELQTMIENIRSVEKSIGNPEKAPSASEIETAKAARKSIITKKAIKAGEVLGPDNITIMRPGTGLPPSEFERIIGQTLQKEIQAFQPLLKEHLN